MAHARRHRKPTPTERQVLYDHHQPPESRRARLSVLGADWNPVVTDDWAKFVPVTEAKRDLFETYFGGPTDELFGPKVQ